MDDERKSGFDAIGQYCQQHGKSTLAHYVAYCEYKKTFVNIVADKTEKLGGELTNEQIQELKDPQLHNYHIERYVKQAEEMLEDTLKNVQKTILEEHQQELKKLHQQELKKLEDTLKNVQKAILDSLNSHLHSHQQEVKKIVQKDNWWTESWLAIGNMILDLFKRLISIIVKR